MASPADALRSRLAQYAYAPSPSKRMPPSPSPGRSGTTTGVTTGVSTGASSGYLSDEEGSDSGSGSGSDSDFEPTAGPSTSRKLRSKLNASKSKSKTELEETEGRGSEPQRTSPSRKGTQKRRADGSLDKLGWKKARKYAAPETYAHLRPVEDCLEVGLKLVFCGINPGKRSATRGHHFAHPTNKFWRALHLSGLTPRLLSPEEDVSFPQLYSYGLTNLVDRPTAEQNELSSAEMRLAVLPLVQKLARARPRVVCFVGKKIWDIFEGVAGREARSRAKATEREVEREERRREEERERVRRDVARQESKRRGNGGEGEGGGAGGVVAFTLVGGDVVKLEPTTPIKVKNVKEEKESSADDPLVSIYDLTPTRSPFFRTVPHSSFAFDAPQRLRLVLPPLSAPPAPVPPTTPPTVIRLEEGTALPLNAQPLPDTPPPHFLSSLPPSSPLSEPPSSPLSEQPSPIPNPSTSTTTTSDPHPSLAPAPALAPTGAAQLTSDASQETQPTPAWGHTYFWVVPNTSGLERTPLQRQAELFSSLRAFVAALEAGEELAGEFVDVSVEDVLKTVAVLPAVEGSPAKRKGKSPGKGARSSSRKR